MPILEIDERGQRRFWAKVGLPDPETGCLQWQASLFKNGYGQFHTQGSVCARAHRVAYHLCVGPIPEGLDLDHLCRNRACVRPDHLEAVTRRENLVRGHTVIARQVAATHCPQGHAYNETNTYRRKNGKRDCIECRRQYDRDRRPKKQTQRDDDGTE